MVRPKLDSIYRNIETIYRSNKGFCQRLLSHACGKVSRFGLEFNYVYICTFVGAYLWELLISWFFEEEVRQSVTLKVCLHCAKYICPPLCLSGSHVKIWFLS